MISFKEQEMLLDVHGVEIEITDVEARNMMFRLLAKYGLDWSQPKTIDRIVYLPLPHPAPTYTHPYYDQPYYQPTWTSDGTRMNDGTIITSGYAQTANNK